MSSAPTDAAAYYSENAVAFHASYRSDANRLERLRVWRSFLDQYADGARSAYDLGCGSGILACEVARRGIATVGIDGAPGMVALASHAAWQAGLANVRFELQRLPLADAAARPQADIVISSSVIEYLDSLDEALRLVHDLLRPGGVTIVSLSNRAAWSRKAVRLVHRLTGYPPYLGLIRHFVTLPELRAALDRAGLAYLTHDYFGRSDRINRTLSVILPPPQSSNMIIVVARRRG